MGSVIIPLEQPLCEQRRGNVIQTCLGSGGFLQPRVASSKSCGKNDPWARFLAGNCPGKKEQSWFALLCWWFLELALANPGAQHCLVPALCWDCLSWDNSSGSRKGICWPRARGRRDPPIPPSSGSGTTPWIKGTASKTARSALSTGTLQGKKCAGRS